MTFTTIFILDKLFYYFKTNKLEGENMSQPKRWKQEIIDVMKKLGGHARYSDIYEMIEKRKVMDFEANKSWKGQVRQTIERFSSDSDTYNGKENIFYSVDGIGKGHWGLLDFEPYDNNVDLTEDDIGFEEGKLLLREHIYRERNQRIIKLAKDKFKKEHGQLYCQICGFNYEKVYGEIGNDYIEAHHIIPISSLNSTHKTMVNDIVLVCANCHRMLHKKRPWITVEELSKLIVNNRW